MKGTLVVDMETVTKFIHNFCDSFSVLSIANTHFNGSKRHILLWPSHKEKDIQEKMLKQRKAVNKTKE